MKGENRGEKRKQFHHNFTSCDACLWMESKIEMNKNSMVFFYDITGVLQRWTL